MTTDTRLVPYLVVLLAALLLVNDVIRREFTLRGLLKQWFAVLGLAFTVYALFSSVWAEDLVQAASAASVALLMILAGVYSVTSLSRMLTQLSIPRRRRFLRAVPIGGTVAIVFLLIELSTDHMLTVATLRSFPELIGARGKGVIFDDGFVVGVMDLYFNRNVSALVLLRR